MVLWEFNGQDNQFWFWDGEMLRNKKFPNKVLDFHWSDYQKNSWGKVYLHNENGGMNQRWILRGDEIFCQYGKHQNLRLLLDVHSSSTQNGAKVGCYSSTGGVNQKWIISKKELIFTIQSLFYYEIIIALWDDDFYCKNYLCIFCPF